MELSKMLKFDPKYFPKYNELTLLEKLFLRTCCYFPPKPRRIYTIDSIVDSNRFIDEYERAFGPSLWSTIRNKKVLDLGCGDGRYSLALASRKMCQVVGLDIQPLFNFAKQEGVNRKYNNLYFINGSTEALANNSFEVIISHDSFEHFQNPKKMLDEIIRITKKDGDILIKFGPTWRGPYGRHMSGTIRNDRPWIHLIIPERLIMHCHSVYHNEPELKNKVSQLRGGLNKMTMKRFRKMLEMQRDIVIMDFRIFPIPKFKTLASFPLVHEFFITAVKAHVKKS